MNGETQQIQLSAEAVIEKLQQKIARLIIENAQLEILYEMKQKELDELNAQHL